MIKQEINLFLNGFYTHTHTYNFKYLDQFYGSKLGLDVVEQINFSFYLFIFLFFWLFQVKQRYKRCYTSCMSSMKLLRKRIYVEDSESLDLKFQLSDFMCKFLTTIKTREILKISKWYIACAVINKSKNVRLKIIFICMRIFWETPQTMLRFVTAPLHQWKTHWPRQWQIKIYFNFSLGTL